MHKLPDLIVAESFSSALLYHATLAREANAIAQAQVDAAPRHIKTFAETSDYEGRLMRRR